MLTAGDRLLSSALVGRGGCPLCAALVGRVRRWRSSVYALRVYNRQLRLRCLFCVLSVFVPSVGILSTYGKIMLCIA